MRPCLLTVAGILSLTLTACFSAKNPDTETTNPKNNDATAQPANGNETNGTSYPRTELNLPLQKSQTPRLPASNVSDAQRNLMVRDNHVFANAYYRQWRQAGANEPKNFIFSPVSISMAFGMLYAGANGDTATQMKTALRWSQPAAEIHAAFNALESIAETIPADGATIQIENALFLDKRQTALISYLDTLAMNYGSGVYQMDTATPTAAEASRVAINQWIAGATNGKIRDMLATGSINGMRFLLSNTIYFKGQWQIPFPISLTTNKPFHLTDATTVNAKTMKGDLNIAVNRSADYVAIEMPYTGGNATMRLVLPNESRFTEVEQLLTGDQPLDVMQNAQTERLYVELPKFSFGTTTNLIALHSAIGMTDIFSEGLADLSGIDGTRNLFVGLAQHAASIAVDEKGTEAAAATVVGGATSTPNQTLQFNRPFFFQILEKSTGALLFFGRVMNPVTSR